MQVFQVGFSKSAYLQTSICRSLGENVGQQATKNVAMVLNITKTLLKNLAIHCDECIDPWEE